MKYNFPLAISTWDEDEYHAIDEVVRSRQFTMGERVKVFEREFAEYLGVRYCVMVNSGSSANLLMVAALSCSKNPSLTCHAGDEVIVPAVSWSTTYFPLQQYGLKLKFVDIDIATLNYDLNALERAVSDKTRLLVAVNLLGNPNNFAEISRIIQSRDIVMIEDNCESLGAEFGGKKTGSFGAMASHSLFFSHHISTMEGGIISTNDEELFHLLLALRAHGWTRDLPKVNKLCNPLPDDNFFESFRFVVPGYNLRPTEIAGAIGSQQLKKLPKLISIRRQNADSFRSILDSNRNLIIQKELGLSSWFGFSLIVNPDAGISRDHLVKKLHTLGIEVRPIVAGNFLRSEAVRYLNYEVFDELKNAEDLHRGGLFIGNHCYPADTVLNELSKI
jgi:CDP-6-deoxy-D-xylo-4-hexulose-3-dehydrase